MLWDGDLSAGEWIAMSLMMLVFWGLIAAVVVALIRSARSDRPRGGDGDTRAHDAAYQALTERFARGDIDEAEFAHRREVLGSSRARAGGGSGGRRGGN